MAKVGELQTTQALILRDCHFGQASEIIALTQAEIKAGESAGYLDSTPAAVAQFKQK